MKYFTKIAKPKMIPPEGNSQGQPLGIPDRGVYTDYPDIAEPIAVPSVLHKHKAKRAGLHYDLRLVDPKTNIAHSWAIRKGLPSKGNIHLAIQQPDHTRDYIDFTGTISSGYGAGSVSHAYRGDATILKATKDKINFKLKKRKYVLIRTGGDKWIIRRY